MTLDSGGSSSDPLQLRAHAFFLALTKLVDRHHLLESAGEPSLGGKLLYVGDLSVESDALVVAGNVAGCATLAATADPAIQRQAIREGIVDFVVTSLDEALRILKNEIRKRNTVAVCVADSSEPFEREMRERGVQPDIVLAGLQAEGREAWGARSLEIEPAQSDPALALLTWQISQAPAKWMPKLDDIALACLRPDSWEHRWIRLSPRYCGRGAMSLRVVYCAPEIAHEILDRVAASVRNGEIEAEVAIGFAFREELEALRIGPRGRTLDKD